MPLRYDVTGYRSKPRATAGGDDDIEQAPSQNSQEQPLSFTPMSMQGGDEYAVVNKNNKSPPTGPAPDATYAVVDKTTKKQAPPKAAAKPKGHGKKGKGKTPKTDDPGKQLLVKIILCLA
jgi:hypothetical protein